jgi:lysylphosphatidylglycerol synthetase-like protein (DUF2156 family)
MTDTVAAPARVVDPAVAVLTRHADHASAFLGMNDATDHFQVPDIDGLIAYRPAGRRYLIQLGGVFAAPQDRPALLTAFESWARSQRRRVVCVQLMRKDAELYAEHGYQINQFGTSYSIDLTGYSLRGRKFVKVRNMVNRAVREGVTVAEVPFERRASVAGDVARIDAAWLRNKGKHTKELDFMIGEVGGRGAPYRRLFLASHGGAPVAYVSYAPAYGSQPGWLYDLTRRTPDAPPGTIEAVFAHALETFQREGTRWLHLGMTPFTGTDPGNELPDVANPWITRMVGLVGKHGQAIYPAATQASFKLKWLPQVVHPEYNAFAGRVRLSGMYALLRLTKTL